MIIQGPKRVAFFLPNTFTALNMACGYASIILAFKGEFYFAAILLLLGAIFDMVDGRVARMTGTQSVFGEQFDSMSDVISFGVAPSLIIYLQLMSGLGRVGIVLSFFYLLCGTLRLARFNANIDKVTSNFFQGIPIPGAALGIVGFVLLSTEFNLGPYESYIAAVYCSIYSLLMITNIPFASFKKSEWVRRNKRKVLALIIFTFLLLISYEQVMIFGVINIYVLSCLVYAFKKRKNLSELFSLEEEAEENEEAP